METIGSLADKIGILELKIFHMNEQTLRKDLSQAQCDVFKGRLAVLKEQCKDLKAELNVLFEDVFSLRKTLKVYRQFKMYNDPAYRKRESR